MSQGPTVTTDATPIPAPWLRLVRSLSPRRLLANLRVQEVSLDGARFWQRTELTKGQRDFFAKLGFDEPPERFVTSPVLE